jgi:transposase
MTSKLSIPALEKETLEQIVRNHSKPYYRNRAQALLLRGEGFKVEALALIYKTREHTVYEWIRRYKLHGFIGLKIINGRGVKAKMTDLEMPQIDLIHAEIRRNPQSLREVSAILSEKFGFEITKSMLKKYLKKNLTTHGIDSENGSNHNKTP